MKAALAVLLTAAVASPAAAMLHPKYYQQARDAAPDVVVIEVAHVVTPRALSGPCRLEGAVAVVERGERLKPGDLIAVEVMCRTRRAEVRAGGVIWQDRDVLLASTRGRAFLNSDNSIALYQYEVLD